MNNAAHLDDIIALRDLDIKKEGQLFDTRIVGGTETPANKYPWMTLVMATQGGSSYLCGGSIISQNHILTGTHELRTNTNRCIITRAQSSQVYKYCTGAQDSQLYKLGHKSCSLR